MKAGLQRQGFRGIFGALFRLPSRPLREPREEALAILSLGFLWLASLGALYFLGLLDRFEAPLVDLLDRERFLPPQEPPMALVEINEVSSEEPWPWPRLDFAVLLREIARIHPRSVVVEPLLYEREARFAAFDDTFRSVLSRFHAITFSAAALLSEEGQSPGPALWPLPSRGPVAGRFPRYTSLWQPPEGLPEGCRVGISNLEADTRTRFRSLPLVFFVRDRFYPSLALVAAAMELQADLARSHVEISSGVVVLCDAQGRVLRRIPVDEQGRLRLRFSSWRAPIPRLPYRELLVATNPMVERGSFPSELKPFPGRQLWIGLTDPSLVHWLRTPQGDLPPVEVELRAAAQIVHGDFLVPTPRWALFGFWVLGALAAARIFPYIRFPGALALWLLLGLIPTVLGYLALLFEGRVFPFVAYWTGLVGILGVALAARVWGYHYVGPLRGR
jgi:adenylate cyclase